MESSHIINGFSGLSREEKIESLARQELLSEKSRAVLNSHLHSDPELQQLYSEISENHLSNFFLPMGLAPNFLVNGDLYAVPMVTEESSVVAAVSSAAKFWAMHGGFRCTVKDTLKTGQVHFTWNGPEAALRESFRENRERIIRELKPVTERMDARGGGIVSMEIRRNREIPGQSYQCDVTFRTGDAMGANFINSVLEELASLLGTLFNAPGTGGAFEPVLAILSNYTPECLVSCTLEAKDKAFDGLDPGLSGPGFAAKFTTAVNIARADPSRAVTHNKGIFNGMDAVLMATANDYRAVEACGHAYAARDGQYRSLSFAEYENGRFRFTLEVPVAAGTVGGLTRTHPMAEIALEILGSPGAEGLMQIVAASGLAANFAAIRSLVTTGIQQGHMKMHLVNILRQLGATGKETEMARRHFKDRTVSHAAVESYLGNLRKQNEG